MERIKEENLGSVVARFLKETGLQTQLNQYRLKQAWPIITGELVKSKTQDLYIKNQTLYVKLSSPVLRSELSLRKKELKTQLNAYVQAQVISDITFVWKISHSLKNSELQLGSILTTTRFIFFLNTGYINASR